MVKEMQMQKKQAADEMAKMKEELKNKQEADEMAKMKEALKNKQSQDASELDAMKKELEALKAELAKKKNINAENSELKAQLQTMQDVQNAKDKDMESAKNQIAEEKFQLKSIMEEKRKADQMKELLKK